MPLEPYYEHGGLNRKFKPIHRAIFRRLLGKGSWASVEGDSQSVFEPTAHDMVDEDQIPDGHFPKYAGKPNEVKEKRIELVEDELRRLCARGFIEFHKTHADDEHPDDISLRVNPSLLAEIHKFVKSKK